MEAAAISNAGEEPQLAASRPGQDNAGVALARATAERTDILDEIDRQLSLFAGAPADRRFAEVPTARPLSGITLAEADARRIWRELHRGREFRIAVAAAALVTSLALGWLAAPGLLRLFDGQLTGKAAVEAVVERIIDAESKGSASAKNKNSSATGFGQFIDDTWLELIRKYRPDLAKGRSKDETLELRREAKLAHEITTRFAERNAAVLKRRGLPVTAGNIYLAHFAGGAGAVAILSAPADADAALVMANADASGRTKREQIVKANPFLERFTVADLKQWADRKMQGQGLHLTELLSASAKK